MKNAISIELDPKSVEGLGKALKKYPAELSQILVDSTYDIQHEAILDMRRPKSGEWYYSKRRRGMLYRASAPGESPAIDTNNLKSMLFVEFDKKGERYDMEGRVISGAKYSGRLEFGIGIKPRPFLRPALEKAQVRMMKRIKKYFT